jgi:hypothetical protein
MAELFGKELGNADFVVTVGGRTSSFKGFVVERIVVRLDQSDGYPCPGTLRILAGIEGSDTGFLLEGSDFNLPVGRPTECKQIGGPARTAWPVLAYVHESAGRLDGVSGTARIDDGEGATAACDFLAVHSSFPLRVDCELRDFVVSADVTLGPGTDRAARGIALKIPPQTLPGVRLKVYCNDNTSIGGCETFPPRR